ncbi:uncharacterized protein LOC127247655 [Andrographis paniculata]|uniref:uncharacterized protein LOC127247655 n=1 Tax=Andrographis paniculata TaxID=175694 RepID=UPI0021E8CB36|nr:uncharacterized protein LOC127247655 [Andrographis paniculata]
MAMEVVHEDMGEGNMQCTNHPYKNSTPGGICAFCLQEKLGKLVSSSFSVAFFPSSSSSSSPSFRSDFGGGGAAAARHHITSSSVNSRTTQANDPTYTTTATTTTRRPRLPFVSTHRKKKKEGAAMAMAMGSSEPNTIVFKRSKSTATPRRGIHFFDGKYYTEDTSPHRRRFWSFLYTSSSKHSTASKKSAKDFNFTSTARPETRERKREDQFVVVDENDESPAFDRKVSRSRSVGCGSRSFSGDLFEKISNGFGDCTLRRVESQREGKPKVQTANKNGSSQDCIKERVKCGGIFSGFMITSSSSSSSSSSYLVSEDKQSAGNGKPLPTTMKNSNSISHGRSRSWGWALASPMRALGKTTSGKRDAAAANKNSTPNLAAIPSLLAVSG